MAITLDPAIIQKFRRMLNKSAVREKFNDVDGTDVWSIMCSATDWIEVVVETIPDIKIKTGSIGAEHRQTLLLMQYIVALDNMRQAIRQLYEYVIGGDSYPLLRDKSIFKAEVSDERYFTHVRAVFATHPVDLDSVNGVRAKDGERFFASWASHGTGTDDFIVFLYSNRPGKGSTQFGINLEKINHFAEERYALLEDLMLQIRRRVGYDIC